MSNSPVCGEAVLRAVAALKMNPRVAEALALAEKEQDRRVAEQVLLTETPAPTFHEEARAAAFAGLLRKAGLPEAARDGAGNIIARRKGTGSGPTLVIGAHLDTVFKEGTPIKVTQEGTKYFAPGISDDAAGLACVLQLARCLEASGIQTAGDIVFAGTVGEEGNGDLRGCKALFGAENDYDGMIVLDCANVGWMLKGSVGSKRYRVKFSGPGGHSLHKFGIAGSAIHALSRAITAVDDIDVPAGPKCTFNFGVIKGGTGVNAIAEGAEAELDVRGMDQRSLEAFAGEVLAAIKGACEKENARWDLQGANAVSLEIEQIGDRPAGCNEDEASVLQAARASQQVLGIRLEKYMFASTDQNVPLFYGLPATTLGAGGLEGNNHSVTEWWDSKDAYLGPQLALLSALALVGVPGVADPILEKRRGASAAVR